MSGREWKPGDAAMLVGAGLNTVALRTATGSWVWVDPRGSNPQNGACFAHETWGGEARPLVVLDPEDREQVERLAKAYATAASARVGDEYRAWENRSVEARGRIVTELSAAFREFAKPSTPPEPTDPRAVVTDRRDNIWRLLADGDWVCTSGPDVGEYLTWDQLAGDRGARDISEEVAS